MVMQRLDVQSPAIGADRLLELIAQPEYNERNIELVEGKIVEIPKPGGEHGQITWLLSFKIGIYVMENNPGIITAAETGFILESSPYGKDTVRALDIAFIKEGKTGAALSAGWVNVAPDLAVEVISPSNLFSDIQLKVAQLLQAGTALVWLVDPQSRTVTVHTKDSTLTLREGDTLTGGDVLPGFELPVADIFPV